VHKRQCTKALCGKKSRALRFVIQAKQRKHGHGNGYEIYPFFFLLPYLFIYFNALEYDRLQKDNPVNTIVLRPSFSQIDPSQQPPPIADFDTVNTAHKSC
jgi:hypothetical protein